MEECRLPHGDQELDKEGDREQDSPFQGTSPGNCFAQTSYLLLSAPPDNAVIF